MTRRSSSAHTYVIRSPAQLRALRSPVRQEILDAMAEASETSIAELAATLGRPPQALYYHVRELERVSLVRRTGTRRYGKSDAVLYAAPAARMVIAYRRGSDGFVADMAKIARSLLRLTERDFRRALRSPSAVTEGPHRNLRVARVKARLSANELAKLNLLLERMFDLFAASRGRRTGRMHALTVGIAPLEERT